MNNLTFGSDELKFGYYETIAGGSGAGPGWDGKSGVHTHMTNTRITGKGLDDTCCVSFIMLFHSLSLILLLILTHNQILKCLRGIILSSLKNFLSVKIQEGKGNGVEVMVLSAQYASLLLFR
jgi:hypothetical protein